MGLFGGSKKNTEERSPQYADFMDTTLRFTAGLKALGGIGYVLVGSGILFIVIIITFMSVLLFKTVNLANDTLKIATEILALLRPLAAIFLIFGMLLLTLERIIFIYVQFKKMQMIMRLTEKMVEKKISVEPIMDMLLIKAIIKDLQKVWGLKLDDSQKTSRKHSPAPGNSAQNPLTAK